MWRPVINLLVKCAHLAQPQVLGFVKLHDYWSKALSQLDMKLLTGSPLQRTTGVLRQHGVVCDWLQAALPGSNTGSLLFMAQRQLQRGEPNYLMPFHARKGFHASPLGALHLILRHLSVPPAVIDLLLFLHTAARLRIASVHGLMQPVHMLRSVRQGKAKIPVPYELLVEPLLRAQGHRLRPAGRPRHASTRPI